LTPATKKKQETHKAKTQAKKKPTRSVEENVVEKHKPQAPKVVRSQSLGTSTGGYHIGRKRELMGIFSWYAAVVYLGNFDTCLRNK
jgi:hypothetical protein